MWIFNLPAIKACPNHKDCAKTCYALKAQRLYWTAAQSREDNFRVAKKDPDKLKHFLIATMSNHRYLVCRIHESGDFFNQEYVDMWYEVAKVLPNIKFYAYTKTRDLWDFSKLDSLPNVNIISSYLNGHLNYGPSTYVRSLANKFGLIVCPATAKSSGKKCNVDCKICQIKGTNNVIFVQH